MSELAAALVLLRPHWLWALAVLPVALWLAWRRQRAGQAWRRHVDGHLLPHLLAGGHASRGWGRWCLLAAAYLLAVLALAGPAVPAADTPQAQADRPLVIAMDLSSAMDTPDLAPSRLLQARAALTTLLAHRGNGDTALVVFSGQAFTVTPLTHDPANVAVFLDALTSQIMPIDGSRADRGIAQAAQLLRQAGVDHGDILVLTHTADAAAARAARAAAAAGYRTWVLGVGTPAGAAHRDADGRIVHSRLEPLPLQALAQAGGGRYLALDLQARAVDSLVQALPHDDLTQGRHGVAGYRELGIWLLWPLLALAALAFRRGGGVWVLVACLGLPLAPAHAQHASAWQRADQAAHARLQDGIAAYRAGEFERAGQLWGQVPGPTAAYNQGNALARAGHYEAAIAAYDRALALQPQMDDAIANRRAVQAAMQRRLPAGQVAPGADGRPVSGPRPGDVAPPVDQGSAGSADEAAQLPHQAPPASSTQPSPPADVSPQDQAQADAAQRARMQQALDSAGPVDTGQGVAAEAAADPAMQEARAAVQARLDQVTDDPGDLLRARFRREYERRGGGGAH